MKARTFLALATTAVCGFAVGALGVRAATQETTQETTYTPTFDRDVAPILFNHCAGCHRVGQVAPFALLTYTDAAKRASLIAQVTAIHYMPPWKPSPGYGDFEDANTLRDAEITTLERWAKAGAPEGNPGDLPPQPHFSDEWQLGKPDLVVEMPQSFQIPAEGEDIYQCFVLPLPLPAGTSVAAIDIRPGNRKVLHHSILYLSADDSARKRAEASDGPGYRCFGGAGAPSAGSLGGWVPGAAPHRLPDGVAMPVPQGADLIMQNHYHPSGKPESDQSEIALYFAKGPVEKTIFNIPLMHLDLQIPAGSSDYEVKTDFVTPIDLDVIGITPHMHLLGHEMKVTATLPTGKIVPLIWIQNWDFNWQGRYQYKSPVILPKGTKIEMQATYDNSAGNPKNPHSPPQLVSWGENTTDEMCIAFIQCETRNPADKRVTRMSLAQQRRRSGYRRE